MSNPAFRLYLEPARRSPLRWISGPNQGVEGGGTGLPGEVAERFNAAVSKAVVPQGTGGSNPSLSAIQSGYPGLLASPGYFPRASLIPKSPESAKAALRSPALGPDSLWASLPVSFGKGVKEEAVKKLNV